MEAVESGWHEQQRAFQARVMTDAEERLGRYPYRTFIGSPVPNRHPTVGRAERVIVVLIGGAAAVATLLGVGAAREIAALTASLTGGIALMAGIVPGPSTPGRDDWAPLLAVTMR